MASLREALERRRRAGEVSVLAYLMAGSVSRERFMDCVKILRTAGVTGLEVGFPFSDPMAEGPVIQRAAVDALSRGTRFVEVLELLDAVSRELPCALMTYLNPILQRGVERTLLELHSSGATALILPDLPVEAVGPFRSARSDSGVDTVLLASPVTDKKRLSRIVKATQGFLYLVSRYGTTGVAQEKSLNRLTQPSDLSHIIRDIRALRPSLPVMVGFGISTPDDVVRYRRAGADGVIVGSVLQDLLSRDAPLEKLGEVVSGLVMAVREPTSP